jgi:hypothetical protein
VAEFVPNLDADDPVVETVVRNNMNGDTRHGLSLPEFFETKRSVEVIRRRYHDGHQFRQPQETREKLTPVK